MSSSQQKAVQDKINDMLRQQKFIRTSTLREFIWRDLGLGRRAYVTREKIYIFLSIS